MEETTNINNQATNKSTFVLKANGRYQDGKVHHVARFPPSLADAMTNSWIKPVKMCRESKCSVNEIELDSVPMEHRVKFIDKLIEKRHYHSITIEDSNTKKKNAVEGRHQSAGGSYVIFEAEFDERDTMRAFNVIPIKEWYHFRGVQTSQFTAEEAERFISSQAVDSVSNAFLHQLMKLEEKERDEKLFKKEFADFDDGSFKPFGKIKHEDDDGDHDHMDFDFSDDADVGKKEKMSSYTKDISFQPGKISKESRDIFKLAQTEGGMEADDDIDEDEDEELENILSKSELAKSGAEIGLKKTEPETGGKKSKKKRSGDDSLNSIQPKKKIVKEVQELPEGALTELEFEAEIRKFFLIRPAIELKQLLGHFKKIVKATPDGDKLLLKICKRICKKLDRSDGITTLVLKDDHKTYH